MRAFTIPSIYSVIDKFTGPVHKMVAANQAFVNSAEVGVARGERLFRKLTPTLSETTKQFFSFAKSAAIAAAVLGTFHFSVDAIKRYETAVQSFRTIVSDLSDKDFAKYESEIIRVAKFTNRSAIDVAESFEKIAGLNAEFAKTSAGLGQVSQAAIILAKASRMELGDSAENLIGIMNQFSLSAAQSDRVINVLAAGQAVGAANIRQTAEAFVNFGAVAAGANITLEQSVGLVQTLGKFSLFGSEAGNKLKGAILRLQRAGVGYASGQFQINDALADANKRIAKLATAKQKDAAITKMFGAENIIAGKILLANAGLFNDFTKKVTGTSEAQKAAEINSNTLSVSINNLQNKWVNMLVSSDQARTSLFAVNKTVQWLTKNLETIVSVGIKILLFFAAWKAIMIATRIALTAYNIVLGITGALSGAASIAIGKNAVALSAYNIAARIATAAQWALNAAMTANPIGLVIVAIAALIGFVALIINKWNEWGAAISFFLGPLGFVISLIQSFRRNWEMITKSFKEGGVLAGLKAIGKVILDAVLMPVQQIAKLIANITGAEWAKNAVKAIEFTRKQLGVNTETDESGNPLPKESINPKQAQRDVMREEISAIRQTNSKLVIEDESGRAKLSGNDPSIKLTPSVSANYAY